MVTPCHRGTVSVDFPFPSTASPVAASAPPSSPPFVVAVAITKGGTGKTTTSAALAVELASGGDPVVLIDVDTQGQAAHALGVVPADRGPGLAGVLVGTATMADALRPARPATDASGPVWILPGSAALAGEAGKMASDMAAGMLAVRDAALAAAAEAGARIVVIDTPPGWGPLSLSSLAAADVVLSPLPPHALVIEALATFDRHLATVQRTRAAFGGAALPRLAFVLPTMVAPRGTAPALALDAIREWAAAHRDGPVVLSPIARSVRVEESPVVGLSVTEHAPEHAASEAYRAAAQAVREAADAFAAV